MADRSLPSCPAATVIPLAPRLELVRSQSSDHVVELLRDLLRVAEAGEITGLVAVPLYARGSGRKKYGLSLGGVAQEDPQLAVRAMDVCQMLLREIALKDAGIG